MLMKHNFLFYCLLISAYSFAQKDLVSSGGNATGTGGTVSYSVGQVAYQNYTSGTGTITQGVQQPFEIFVVLANNEFATSFSATLFPNPAITSVVLTIDTSVVGTKLIYELTDVTGKLIRTNRITSDETIINVEGFAEACYFLNIIDGNKRVKTFKLLKNN